MVAGGGVVKKAEKRAAVQFATIKQPKEPQQNNGRQRSEASWQRMREVGAAIDTLWARYQETGALFGVGDVVTALGGRYTRKDVENTLHSPSARRAFWGMERRAVAKEAARVYAAQNRKRAKEQRGARLAAQLTQQLAERVAQITPLPQAQTADDDDAETTAAAAAEAASAIDEAKLRDEYLGAALEAMDMVDGLLLRAAKRLERDGYPVLWADPGVRQCLGRTRTLCEQLLGRGERALIEHLEQQQPAAAG